MAYLLHYIGVCKPSWWEMKDHSNMFATLNGAIVRIYGPIMLIALTMNIILNYKKYSFDTLGIMFAVWPVAFVTNVKLLSSIFIKSYKKVLGEFFGKIHVYNYYKRTNDPFAKVKLLQVERNTRLTGFFIGIILFMDWCLWFTVPIINNISNQELVKNKTVRLQTCLYLWTPFDYGYNYNTWVLMHINSALSTLYGCSGITVFDTMNLAIIFNLIAHIEIFKNNIKVRFHKKLNQEEMRFELIEMIKYYAFITEKFKDIQSAFGINVAGNYLQNLFEDSLLLYELMFMPKSDRMLFGLMFLVYVGELVIMSFVLEEIRRQSEDIGEVVYCNIHWEEMSTSNKKIFLLFLSQVQPTMTFKAACGLTAGVKPMISILKSTFSYYIMLKSSVKS
ncbi:uncharacterized protein LOC131849456 [Achroia grisella]|uniref:uncharacterized protein LOC131849456 n=1 Tax=Achroia grisella TaxID=688607 RepID=UPI0027D22860|nr:uncharacterized protein LOC131849456 [Achroia grisella]